MIWTFILLYRRQFSVSFLIRVTLNSHFSHIIYCYDDMLHFRRFLVCFLLSYVLTLLLFNYVTVCACHAELKGYLTCTVSHLCLSFYHYSQSLIPVTYILITVTVILKKYCTTISMQIE